MSGRGILAAAAALAIVGMSAVAQAARVGTDWVEFRLRRDEGNIYVYPKPSQGSPGFVFAGNCQFNALVLADSGDRHLRDLLLTAEEQSLRVSLWYDDTEGPLCQVADVHIEWAD
jgi:hypothetical protein